MANKQDEQQEIAMSPFAQGGIISKDASRFTTAVPDAPEYVVPLKTEKPDIIKDILDMVDKIEKSRPHYGDADKRYLCIAPANLPQDSIRVLEQLSNVSVKAVAPEYLPETNSIYFIPDEKMKYEHVKYRGDNFGR